MVCVVAVMALMGCADQTNNPAPYVPDDPAAAPGSDGSGAPGGSRASGGPGASGSSTSATTSTDGTEPASDAPDAGATSDDDGGAHTTTTCAKQLTVILTVGVPGLSKWKTNGCWKPVVTDGASVSSFRKCSTSTFKVTNNPTAPNWAYDDTNPTHNPTTEKSFFASCNSGATGDGYVFMAYSSGWRYLDAPTVKAHFAELYTSEPTDIDSHYAAAGVYNGNTQLESHDDVYPMMNFGPPASANLTAKVKSEAAKLCATVKTNGYLGLYNATYSDGMAADDPRLLAVEAALDACTQ